MVYQAWGCWRFRTRGACEGCGSYLNWMTEHTSDEGAWATLGLGSREASFEVQACAGVEGERQRVSDLPEQSRRGVKESCTSWAVQRKPDKLEHTCMGESMCLCLLSALLRLMHEFTMHKVRSEACTPSCKKGNNSTTKQ